MVLLQYERPVDQGAAVQAKRAEYGQGYYDLFAGQPAPATPPPTPPTAPTSFKVGDIVQFTGGGVYVSSTATIPAHSRNKSRCKVTQLNPGAKNPIHLISEDDGKVHGWVTQGDVAAIEQPRPF